MCFILLSEGVAPLELEYSIRSTVYYKYSAPTELVCFASLSDIQQTFRPLGLVDVLYYFVMKVSLLWSLSILYVPLCITNIPLLRSWCVLPLCLIFNKRFVRWGWWMYYIILL